MPKDTVMVYTTKAERFARLTAPKRVVKPKPKPSPKPSSRPMEALKKIRKKIEPKEEPKAEPKEEPKAEPKDNIKNDDILIPDFLREAETISFPNSMGQETVIIKSTSMEDFAEDPSIYENVVKTTNIDMSLSAWMYNDLMRQFKQKEEEVLELKQQLITATYKPKESITKILYIDPEETSDICINPTATYYIIKQDDKYILTKNEYFSEKYFIKFNLSSDLISRKKSFIYN